MKLENEDTIFLAPRHSSTPIKSNICHRTRERNELNQTEYIPLNLKCVNNSVHCQRLDSAVEKLESIQQSLKVNEEQIGRCNDYLKKLQNSSSNLKVHLDIQNDQITQMISSLEDISNNFNLINVKSEQLLLSLF